MQMFTARGYIGPLEHGESCPHILGIRDAERRNDKAVVKFKGNSQGNSILAHDLIGTMLADRIGLTALDAGLIEISDSWLYRNPECRRRDGKPFDSGLQFATRFLPDTKPVLLRQQLVGAPNRVELYGVIVLDTWLYNWDRCNNQGNLLQDRTTKKLYVVDQGFCFGGRSTHRRANVLSTQADEPIQLQGRLYDMFISELTDEAKFTKYISAVSGISDHELAGIINHVPDEWGVPYDDKARMVEYLLKRRMHLSAILSCLYRKEVRW